jgi:hypothetical protein
MCRQPQDSNFGKVPCPTPDKFYGKGCIADASEMRKVVDDARDYLNYSWAGNSSCVSYKLVAGAFEPLMTSSNVASRMIGLGKFVSFVATIVASMSVLRSFN